MRGEFEEVGVDLIGVDGADGFRDARVQPHTVTCRETVENPPLHGRLDEAMAPWAPVGLDEGEPTRFAEQVEAFQGCAVDDGREHVDVETASDDGGDAEEFGALG
ncbi:MAG TPA: hypothetical protein VK402_18140 [Blastococcus sp.]|nr:hypothetical protein [Blastococcus sp.]